VHATVLKENARILATILPYSPHEAVPLLRIVPSSF